MTVSLGMYRIHLFNPTGYESPQIEKNRGQERAHFPATAIYFHGRFLVNGM